MYNKGHLSYLYRFENKNNRTKVRTLVLSFLSISMEIADLCDESAAAWNIGGNTTVHAEKRHNGSTTVDLANI